jgi:hypothetical protein
MTTSGDGHNQDVGSADGYTVGTIGGCGIKDRGRFPAGTTLLRVKEQ